jgi:ribosomal protein S27AE
MKCADCGEKILQKNPQKCPYCGSTSLFSIQDIIPTVTVEIEKLKKAGKYEDAALKYEEIEMWDKAKEIRELNIGKVRAITIECPHCGESQLLSSKNNTVTCKHCGKNYSVPKKALDSL